MGLPHNEPWCEPATGQEPATGLTSPSRDAAEPVWVGHSALLRAQPTSEGRSPWDTHWRVALRAQALSRRQEILQDPGSPSKGPVCAAEKVSWWLFRHLPRCSGVFPSPSLWLGSAPWSRRSCTGDGKTQEELSEASLGWTLSPTPNLAKEAHSRHGALKANTVPHAVSFIHSLTHSRTHARTQARTHARTHRAHGQDSEGQELSIPGGPPGLGRCYRTEILKVKESSSNSNGCCEGSQGHFLLLAQPSATVGTRPIEGAEHTTFRVSRPPQGWAVVSPGLLSYPDGCTGRLQPGRPGRASCHIQTNRGATDLDAKATTVRLVQENRRISS